jgi:oxaloacetate decarboxylase alpha subunit
VVKQSLSLTESSFQGSFASQLIKNFQPEDIFTIAPLLDNLGFTSMNWWNSQNFSDYLDFYHLNPWTFLERLKKNFHIPQQVDLQGNQLITGRIFAPEVIQAFLEQLKEHKIERIRLFHPLNDCKILSQVLNLIDLKYFDVSLGMFLNPQVPNSFEIYNNLLACIQSYSIKEISILEPTGLLQPQNLHDILELVQKQLDIPIHLKIEGNRETLALTLFKAISFGIQGIDVTSLPNNSQHSLPSLKNVLQIVDHLDVQVKVKLEEVIELEKQLLLFRKAPVNQVQILHDNLEAFNYRLPYTFIRELLALLRDINLEKKLSEIVSEIKTVISEFGYPPLVIPYSSAIISQSLFNIVDSNRYFTVPIPVKKYIMQLWGEPRQIISDSILKKIIPKIDDFKDSKNRLLNQEIINFNHHSNKNNRTDTSSHDRENQITNFLAPISNEKYHQYLSIPNYQEFDVTNRQILANLMYSIFEWKLTQISQTTIPKEQNNVNLNKWQYNAKITHMNKL